jgi:hypothetical protein
MTTTIIVLASNNQPIGACQSLTVKEYKAETEEGTITSVKLEVPRMRFDRSKLSETFEKGHFHVASQVYPVHIVVLEDKTETFRATNAWITGIATTYSTGEWILAEGVELDCEDVTGTISPAA